MAIIPTQSKYPDRAGYLGLDTDRNTVEVFSDGKFGTVGSIPFDHDIYIYVGPGGDFEDHIQALDYIQHLRPKFTTVISHRQFRGQTRGLTPFVALIFKENYIFKSPMNFTNCYYPWLYIKQENMDIPLNVTMETQNPDTINSCAPIISLDQSIIGKINLNLNYIGNISQSLIIGMYLQDSILYECNFSVNNIRTGISADVNAIISTLKKLKVTNFTSSGLSIQYYSFVHASGPINIQNDIKPSDDTNGIMVNSGIFRPYSTANTIINNVKYGLNLRGQAQIRACTSTPINIDNTDYAICLREFSQLVLLNPITIGPNVTNIIYPLDLQPNVFDYRGIIIAPNGIQIT